MREDLGRGCLAVISLVFEHMHLELKLPKRRLLFLQTQPLSALSLAHLLHYRPSSPEGLPSHPIQLPQSVAQCPQKVPPLLTADWFRGGSLNSGGPITTSFAFFFFLQKPGDQWCNQSSLADVVGSET